jgi:predicted ribosome quality control (RQC) complex YloA/Tae2 family protein
VLSAAELLLLAEELDAALRGARLQKLHARTPAVLALEFHAPERGASAAILSLEPSFPRFVLGEAAGTNPERPPAWLTALRDWLLGARVRGIRTVPRQRILILDLTASHEGQPTTRTLLLELFGRLPRLYVLDSAGVVRARHASTSDHSTRGALGEKWVEPEQRAPSAAEQTPFAFLPTPLPHPLSAAIEAHAQQVVHTQASTTLRSNILQIVSRKLTKDEQHRERLLRNERAASTATEVRAKALLLQQMLSSIREDALTADLHDPMQPDAPAVHFEFAPRLGPKGTLQKLFREAEQKEATWARASADLGLVDAKLLALRALQAAVEDPALADEELLARARALDCAPVTETTLVRRRVEQAPRLPYRTFLSRDGVEILVGRTAADNDRLTFDVASGNNIWLHVADHPGSHVVIRCEKTAPEQTLLDAAALAAHFSRCGEGARPAVSWTLVKHVRKFSGAKPGQVQLADRRHVQLRSEPDRLQRLLASEKRREDS